VTQAIQQLVKKFQVPGGPEIRCNLEALDEFFSDAWDINVYRIIEQALVNAMKHAQASLIEITGSVKEGKLSVIIKDNGVGMDIESVESRQNRAQGLGLKLMQERTRILGGNMQIVSQRGSGTEIQLALSHSK